MMYLQIKININICKIGRNYENSKRINLLAIVNWQFHKVLYNIFMNTIFNETIIQFLLPLQSTIRPNWIKFEL